MNSVFGKLEVRGGDKWGEGHYGASRGKRSHVGIDYIIEPGCVVLSPLYGTVTKIGHAYSDDLSFEYVEITSESGYRHRLFYVDSDVVVGDPVWEFEVVGTAQELGERYPGITPHVHYEIKTRGGSYIDPESYWEA